MEFSFSYSLLSIRSIKFGKSCKIVLKNLQTDHIYINMRLPFKLVICESFLSHKRPKIIIIIITIFERSKTVSTYVEWQYFIRNFIFTIRPRTGIYFFFFN